MDLLLKIKEEKISPSDFLSELWKLSEGLKRKGAIIRAVQRIYRTRTFKHEERPKTILNLSYPPVDKIKVGRANDIGEQIFYASANTPLTIREARVAEGQFIVMSEWLIIKDIIFQMVGINENQTLSEVEKICHDIFSSTDPNTYPYSSKIANYLLSGKEIGGIIYPSVIEKNTSHNLAIKKEFVDSNLRFSNCGLYRIDKITDDMTFHVTELDYATNADNGLLKWKGETRSWSGGPGTATPDIKLIFNGWFWDAFDSDGSYIEPDK
ncbi:RES family NAD+ phosphorylase [Ferruginibacter sp.]